MRKNQVVSLKIRKAKLDDCVAMKDIINAHADDGLMLYRSLNQLIMMLPQYFVAETEKEIIGVCGYRIWPSEGVEIISSAVKQNFHGLGIGQRLIWKCVKITNKMGFKKFFALTLQADYFAKLGFKIVSKESLSPKIYSECMYCRKNRSNIPDKIECDEVAVTLKLP